MLTRGSGGGGPREAWWRGLFPQTPTRAACPSTATRSPSPRFAALTGEEWGQNRVSPLSIAASALGLSLA